MRNCSNLFTRAMLHAEINGARMQSNDSTNVQQPANAAPQADHVRELSVQELLQVSGGSPRGGWAEPVPGAPVLMETNGSPRGGW